jgi:hypothetical protein
MSFLLLRNGLENDDYSEEYLLDSGRAGPPASIDSFLVSEILKSDYMIDDLMELCEFEPDQKWRLVYQASRDGYGADDFHAHCDGIGQTLTVIQSTTGNIFGGYTEAEWDESGCYKRDPCAFMFSLTNQDDEPVKMNLIQEKSAKTAIWCGPKCGPTFGSNDLDIADEPSVNNCRSILGCVYRHPKYSNGSYKSKTFLAGEFHFQVSEIEVYEKLNTYRMPS